LFKKGVRLNAFFISVSSLQSSNEIGCVQIQYHKKTIGYEAVFMMSSHFSEVFADFEEIIE